MTSAIRNTTDRSSKPPRLRLYLNLGTVTDLPATSTGPRGPLAQVLQAVRDAGYEGVQGSPDDVAAARSVGLAVAGSGRVDTPAQAGEVARWAKDAGFEAVTLHVGTGLEDDAAADAVFSAIIEASVRCDVPMYVETHRATITQDIYRTVKLAERHPDIRFNGDFSHWYTGLEMVYGDWQRKLEFMKPVLDRVRFVHGRIGNPGSMQVDVGDGSTEGQPFVGHFIDLWTRSFRGFLASASAGDYICFAPELLYPKIYYARVFDGHEETDRWEQALVLNQIARKAFDAALDSMP